MKRFNNILTILAAALVLAALVSCERRPLHDPSEYVEIRVKVNVKNVNNATIDIYNESVPIPNLSTDMMRVLVYDPSSKKLMTQSFISGKSYDEEDGSQILSGTLNIAYGNYDFLVYNFDTPVTMVSSEADESAIIAYTTEIPTAQKARYSGRTKADDDTEDDVDDLEDLDMRYEPDHLLVAREHDFRVSPHDKVLVIETEARTIVDSYYIQIHVEGMQYASAATAVISGLAPSNHFGVNERDDDPSVAVAFDLMKSTDPKLPGENKDVLCAVFNTFGKIPEIASDLIVTFNVIDVSGHLQQYSTSLNTVFLTEDAIEHHWLLIDETWVIDNPIPDEPRSGGFQPNVDDWEEEHGEIVI